MYKYSDSPSGEWRRQWAPIALLAVLGIAISAAVFFAAYSWEHEAIRSHFDSLAEDRSPLGMAAMFAASQR
jgi:hypothetical protein